MDTNPAPTNFVPTLTLLFGGLMFIVGVLIMVSGSESTSSGLTLAAIGFVLEASGMGALAYPSARKHLMHVAILAVLFGMGNVFSALPEAGEEWGRTELLTAGCSVLCAVLFAVYLKSFVNARRGGASTSSAPLNQ